MIKNIVPVLLLFYSEKSHDAILICSVFMKICMSIKYRLTCHLPFSRMNEPDSFKLLLNFGILSTGMLKVCSKQSNHMVPKISKFIHSLLGMTATQRLTVKRITSVFT